jgi:hypothetical protein
LRTHGSLREALEYAVRHHASIPKTGQVALVAEGVDGQTTTYLRDGHVAMHTVDPIIGLTTIHTYKLVGGDFTATPAGSDET